MTTSPSTPARPSRRWRRLFAIAAGLVVLAVIVAIGLLPVGLSSDAGRRWLLGRANAALAPGRLDVDAMRFSWTGPLRLGKITLQDREGRPVVTAESAIWDRNLRQFLMESPRFGSLTLNGADFDIVRDDAGRLNLIEVLKPILKPNPKTELKIAAPGAVIRIESPELVRPIEAERSEVAITLPLNLEPLDWRMTLGHGDDERLIAHLELDRHFDRPEDEKHLLVDLDLRRWPLALAKNGLTLGFQGDGKAHVERRPEGLAVRGDLVLSAIDAGLPFVGDRPLHLDRFGVVADLLRQGDRWSIRAFKADSDGLDATASGVYPPGPDESFQADASLDLPTLVARWPGALPWRDGLTLERGRATVHLEAKPDGASQRIDAEAVVADLAARVDGRDVAIGEPATLRASLDRSAGTLAIRDLGVSTSFLELTGRGDLQAGLSLGGSIDLDRLTERAKTLLDLGDRALHGRGTIDGAYRPTEGRYVGSLGVDFTNLAVDGLPMLPIREPTARLNFEARGPADESGRPTGWDALTLGLDAATLHAQLIADETLHASLDLPLRIRNRDGRLSAHAEGNWRDSLVDLANAMISWNDGLPESQPLALAFAARYDAAAGSLDLTPRPGSSGVVEIGAAGIHLTGLGTDMPRLEGDLLGDWAALDRGVALLLDREPIGVAGSWSSSLLVDRVGPDYQIRGRFDSADLNAPPAREGRPRVELPFESRLVASYDPDADRLTLEDVGASGNAAGVKIAGQIDALRTARVADLQGTFTIDDEMLRRFVEAKIEPEAKVGIRPRPFHLRGPLRGGSLAAVLRKLDASAGVDIVDLDIFGLRAGEFPLAASVKDGRVAIEILHTDLNGGVLDVRPIIDLDDPRGVFLVLEPNSGFDEVEINAEVSRRVFSYVAPVLYDAGTVRGFVSGRVDGAEFPIGPVEDAGASVQGTLQFRDTTFTAGPLGRDLLGLVGKGELVLLRLNQQIPFQIQDGRVYQSGMELPIANLAAINVAGSVGLDRTLDLAVAVPIVPKGLDRVPIVGDVVGGLKIRIPVTGTLAKPKIDRAAFDAGMQQMGRDVAGRGAAVGAPFIDMIRDIGAMFPKRQNRPRRDR